MKELLKGIPITTLLLTYLFICGTLYLIGFWGTFDINVFSLIEIYDIPKNFVFPFLISQGFFIFSFAMGNIATFNDDRKNIDYFITVNPEWRLRKRITLGILTFIDFWVILIISLLFLCINEAFKNQTIWGISSIIFAYYLLHKFVNLKQLKENIKSNILRAYLGYFIIFFPIISFSTGKITSLNIFHNKECKIVKTISPNSSIIVGDSTELKFLGYISDQVILSSLDNKKVYILNKASLDGIELKNK